MWKKNRGKPVIGLAGGIGSGKSMVGRLFGSQGCAVIDSDALAHEALQLPEVRGEIMGWLGREVFGADGCVDRKAVAGRVFSDAGAAKRLAGIIHPRVGKRREELMGRALAAEAVKAILWDTPLLFETGLEGECDAVVFVEVPREMRLKRLAESRGWTEEELGKREKLQFPLDKKAGLADYCIDNSGDEASTLRQVQQVLSQILATPV